MKMPGTDNNIYIQLIYSKSFFTNLEKSVVFALFHNCKYLIGMYHVKFVIGVPSRENLDIYKNIRIFCIILVIFMINKFIWVSIGPDVLSTPSL